MNVRENFIVVHYLNFLHFIAKGSSTIMPSHRPQCHQGGASHNNLIQNSPELQLHQWFVRTPSCILLTVCSITWMWFSRQSPAAQRKIPSSEIPQPSLLSANKIPQTNSIFHTRFQPQPNDCPFVNRPFDVTYTSEMLSLLVAQGVRKVVLNEILTSRVILSTLRSLSDGDDVVILLNMLLWIVLIQHSWWMYIFLRRHMSLLPRSNWVDAK